MTNRIPLILITGFLGAGKTTFINWLLAQHPDKKISLILNEFGDTQLESQFVKQHADNIVELANGCMCCVANSDIPRVIQYIVDHSPETEFILIEASGLSDPDPVREALQTAPVKQWAYLESIICIVDALNFETSFKEHAIVGSQIGDADLIVLAKVKTLSNTEGERITTQLKHLTPDIRVLSFDESLSPDIFLSYGQPQTHRAEHQSHDHIHEQYQTMWYTTPHILDLEKLVAHLRALPADIIRIKGIISSPLATFLVQKVGSRVMVEARENHQPPPPNSTLLFIGRHFDETTLRASLDDCKSVSS